MLIGKAVLEVVEAKAGVDGRAPERPLVLRVDAEFAIQAAVRGERQRVLLERNRHTARELIEESYSLSNWEVSVLPQSFWTPTLMAWAPVT